MSTRAAFQCFNGLAPRGVPKAIPVTLDFSSDASVYIDLSVEEQFQTIEFVQGVFVDNVDNLNALVLEFEISGQRLEVPAQTQGTYPVIAPESTKVTISTTPSADLSVDVFFLNVPMPYSNWGAVTVNAVLNPVAGAFSSKSGSVALGGASQQLSAANANRKRIIIQNPSTDAGQNIATAESLFINFTGAAGVDDGTSIEIFPGGSFDSNFGPVPSNAITVTAATTNHRWIAYEF